MGECIQLNPQLWFQLHPQFLLSGLRTYCRSTRLLNSGVHVGSRLLTRHHSIAAAAAAGCKAILYRQVVLPEGRSDEKHGKLAPAQALTSTCLFFFFFSRLFAHHVMKTREFEIATHFFFFFFFFFFSSREDTDLLGASIPYCLLAGIQTLLQLDFGESSFS